MTASTQRNTERLSTDDAGLARAAELLGAGRLVAFPTETVYGLGADGRNGTVVAALYEAKGRPAFNPLIAHVPAFDAARREGDFGPDAMRLAGAFWPGPLTLVVPCAKDGGVCDLARAGLDTVGLRVPSDPLARDLLTRCGFPVVAPSANLSGRISPTAATDVLADLDRVIDAVVMAGPTPVGVESTIVACLGDAPRLLRPGGVTREAIEGVLGHALIDDAAGPDRPLAPGALVSHYAPQAAVRLNAADIRPGEAFLAFGPDLPSGHAAVRAVRNLSASGDLAEAAANLFSDLRALDAAGAAVIAVAPIPNEGLGEAINDRLSRAAAER